MLVLLRYLALSKNVESTLVRVRVLALTIAFSACSPVIAQDDACRSNLNLLGQDLISMLRKIPVMPPIEKTNLALKYSKSYGRRY